ncbi:MAG: RsmE family RNA methyltransferase [bacterium]
MRLHRFYLNKKIEKEVHINDKELLHQWLKVFRLKASNRIIIFNGGDIEYEGYFKILKKKEAVLIIDKEKKVEKNQQIELYYFCSIIKKDKFELIVEKCTEIGVSFFYPILSERSEKKNLNIERLNKIAKEAVEQSGRIILPKIFSPELLEKIISDFSDFNGKLFVLDFDGASFAETFIKNINNENIQNKNENEKTRQKIGLFIGPEGGWSDKEKKFFKQKKIQSISLGSQILRAETSAIVASALILTNDYLTKYKVLCKS